MGETLTLETFRTVVAALGQQATEDIAWSQSITPPTDPDDFALEAIFVICNSGMKNTVARRIFEKCRDELFRGGNARNVFGHLGKATAINDIWNGRADLFTRYMAAIDKLEFCASLPWIGNITKYHLAKNFGADVAKPDVHLQRLADREGTTAQALCERLAKETGWRTATIDVVLWRACANGVINSRTGEIRPSQSGDGNG
ncbi:hypothetical protein [Mesorhizobium sp. WSM4308]|uniref:hypothetical protein n=1 Tax=Mesorhizobium sp. WSM4308 TaxID=2029409 RepID=UPI00117E53DB|nr:hypothetical protein [Mesorhizobium sp. WSM4308]